MEILSDDELYIIFSYLNAGDIYNLQKVNQRFRSLITSKRHRFPLVPIADMTVYPHRIKCKITGVGRIKHMVNHSNRTYITDEDYNVKVKSSTEMAMFLLQKVPRKSILCINCRELDETYVRCLDQMIGYMQYELKLLVIQNYIHPVDWVYRLPTLLQRVEVLAINAECSVQTSEGQIYPHCGYLPTPYFSEEGLVRKLRTLEIRGSPVCDRHPRDCTCSDPILNYEYLTTTSQVVLTCPFSVLKHLPILIRILKDVCEGKLPKVLTLYTRWEFFLKFGDAPQSNPWYKDSIFESLKVLEPYEVEEEPAGKRPKFEKILGEMKLKGPTGRVIEVAVYLDKITVYVD